MVYGRTLIWHQWEHGAARQDYFYGLGVAPEPVLSAATALPSIAAQPLPEPNHLQRADASKRRSSGGRIRSVFPYHVRRPALLRQDDARLSGARFGALLGALSPAWS